MTHVAGVLPNIAAKVSSCSDAASTIFTHINSQLPYMVRRDEAKFLRVEVFSYGVVRDSCVGVERLVQHFCRVQTLGR